MMSFSSAFFMDLNRCNNGLDIIATASESFTQACAPSRRQDSIPPRSAAVFFNMFKEVVSKLAPAAEKLRQRNIESSKKLLAIVGSAQTIVENARRLVERAKRRYSPPPGAVTMSDPAPAPPSVVKSTAKKVTERIEQRKKEDTAHRRGPVPDGALDANMVIETPEEVDEESGCLIM